MKQWEGWGEDYLRFLRRGMDHSDAAFRADEALRRRRQRERAARHTREHDPGTEQITRPGTPDH